MRIATKDGREGVVHSLLLTGHEELVDEDQSEPLSDVEVVDSHPLVVVQLLIQRLKDDCDGLVAAGHPEPAVESDHASPPHQLQAQLIVLKKKFSYGKG